MKLSVQTQPCDRIAETPRQEPQDIDDMIEQVLREVSDLLEPILAKIEKDPTRFSAVVRDES